MATPNVGILTTAGKALIDKVNSGQAKISFSKIVFSSMDNSQLSDMQVKALTAIAPQEVVVSSPETTLDTNSGETRIRATGTNEKLADGVYVKTYGVFAKDDTGSEILYGVTVSPNPNYFPAYDGVTPQAVTYSYKTVIQETSNITMTNSNDVYASQEDLTEALQPYAKTVDVNQQLDKKVNIADMRKPANDVAGIEEVNAKQDKIGYTPADDSKVVHTSDTSNWQKQAMSLPSTLYLGTNPWGTKFATYVNANFNSAGVYYIRDNNAPAEGADHQLDVTLLVEPGGAWKYAFGVSWGNGMYYRSVTPNGDSGWKLVANDSAVVHTTDMRKPASDVAGIEEVNAKQDKIGYTPADDSKVAHLSGANNFDTVPTVNNNPLLLASSLPSDLARTSQQTNFTAGLKSGGVDVATAADLKSIEDASWHTITGKSEALSAYTCMYRKNNKQKYVDLVLYGTMGISMAPSDPSEKLLDLSVIINSLNDINGIVSCPEPAATGGGVGHVSVSGTNILFSWQYNNTIIYSGSPITSSGSDLNSPFLRVTFN